MLTSIIINPEINWNLFLKSLAKKICFHDFRSEKAIFVTNDNPLKMCIVSRHRNVVNFKCLHVEVEIGVCRQIEQEWKT